MSQTMGTFICEINRFRRDPGVETALAEVCQRKKGKLEGEMLSIALGRFEVALPSLLGHVPCTMTTDIELLSGCI